MCIRDSFNPNGVASWWQTADTTPLGLKIARELTQGSSCLATLGWRTQSRWDCRTPGLSVVPHDDGRTAAVLVSPMGSGPRWHRTATMPVAGRLAGWRLFGDLAHSLISSLMDRASDWSSGGWPMSTRLCLWPALASAPSEACAKADRLVHAYCLMPNS